VPEFSGWSGQQGWIPGHWKPHVKQCPGSWVMIHECLCTF